MTFIDFWQERNAADYTVQPMQRHGKIIFLFSSHGNLLFSFVFFFRKRNRIRYSRAAVSVETRVSRSRLVASWCKCCMNARVNGSEVRFRGVGSNFKGNFGPHVPARSELVYMCERMSVCLSA